MNVGYALRYFSPKTASALTTAVAAEKLPEAALTTAHFINEMHDYFSLMTSQQRKNSITLRNCDKKYIFLNVIIDLFQNTIFGKGWKPLNYALVLSSLSFMDVSEFLMKNEYDFVLGHRFTQDATENVIGQVRNRFGKMPSAYEALIGLRLISVSQFLSDIKRSNYMSDTDEFLLDFCKEKKSTKNKAICHSVNNITAPVGTTTASFTPSNVKTLSLDQLSIILTNKLETNGIFFIAGSTTRAVNKHLCSDCEQFLLSDNLPKTNFVTQMKNYTVHANKGGLSDPCLQTLHLVLLCEYYFRMFKNYILKNGNLVLVNYLIAKINISFPLCCDLKKKIVKHFFTVRSFCLKSFSERCKTVYGTASAKRKKV